MDFLDYNNYYLVGIKGVAMTALAQCLVDAGRQVSGCDVAEDFVTAPLLADLGIHIDEGFSTPLPDQVPNEIECVIYTAAHGGSSNPVVLQAQASNVAVFSHAQALAALFNLKQGIAVSGVGGKSTTSAMIAWILEGAARGPSFAIGVGNIPGLNRTGRWHQDSKFFVAEADEYATNPTQVTAGASLIPRFAFYEPMVTVCTNLRFDHPDVYRDIDHTKQVFGDFFKQLRPNGKLVINGDDTVLLSVVQDVNKLRSDITALSFGETAVADLQILSYQSQPGLTLATLKHQNQSYELKLRIPGKFNIRNAAAAILVCHELGIEIDLSCSLLANFRSTQRRSEFIGEKNGVLYYDDYAHHPSEVQQVLSAFRDWFPDRRLIVAFQSHTLSRTKSLFDQFSSAFSAADEVAMIDIFTSARESDDGSVTSEQLCAAIEKKSPKLIAKNYQTLDRLADHLASVTKTGDVVLTVGAGDIYKVHELIK